MRYSLSALLIILALGLNAQITRSLVAHYAFDDCVDIDSSRVIDISGVGTNGQWNNNVDNNPIICGCGVLGNSAGINLGNGTNHDAFLLGQVNNHFEQEDFSVSLYFKSAGTQSIQTILSKTGQ